MSLCKAIPSWFSLDTRSLAIARMIFGFTIFFDSVALFWLAQWHYTDLGALPRGDVGFELSNPLIWSIYNISGSLGFVWFAMAAHACCALALALGYRTRIATVFVLLFAISLELRNPILSYGADRVIRSFLWIAVFLPWGEMWSVDQLRKKSNDGAEKGRYETLPRLVSGSWVACWFLLVFCVYFMGFLNKSSPSWVRDHTALQLALNLDLYTSALGKAIRDFNSLLKPLSFIVIWLEGVAPWFLIGGWLAPARWRWPLKVLLISVFSAFHLGTFVLMKLGNWPALCFAIWVALIPHEVWALALKWKPNISALLERVFSQFARPATGNPGATLQRPFVSVLSQGFGVFMFVNLVFANLGGLRPPLQVVVPFWESVKLWTHTGQKWTMFAPTPPRTNFWIEIPAVFEEGSRRELISGDVDLESSKKQAFYSQVWTSRLAEFYRKMQENPINVRLYAQAHCRLTNLTTVEGKQIRLKSLAINLFYSYNLDDLTKTELQKRTLIEHSCDERL